MPFKGGKAQMRAMFAKGGKSARTAAQWVRRYGKPTREHSQGRAKKGS